MNLYRKKINEVGSTLVEVLVAIGLVGILMPALVTALVTSSSARPTVTQKLIATSQLQQMTAAINSIRNTDWNSFAVDGTYHTTVSGSQWALASGSQTTNGFTDQVVISDVNRDSSGNIVASGGTSDPSSKLVVESVSWTYPTSSSISSDIYLTNWGNSSQWTQTTQADFTADSLVNTNVTNTSGGEVALTTGQASGTLNSLSFDAGKTVSFNYLSFNDVVPSGTNIQIQVATNNDDSTWNYVGPDGTSSTYFTSPGSIPYSAFSGRYIRYRATFTTTNSNIPILNDITVSYTD